MRNFAMIICWLLMPWFAACQRSALGPFPIFVEAYLGSENIKVDRESQIDLKPLRGYGLTAGFAVTQLYLKTSFHSHKQKHFQDVLQKAERNSFILSIGTRYAKLYPLSFNIWVDSEWGRESYDFKDQNHNIPNRTYQEFSGGARVMLFDPIGTGGGLGVFFESVISRSRYLQENDYFFSLSFRAGLTAPLALRF